MGMIKRCAGRFRHFLRSRNGDRFFNCAYSIGAAIVLWGVLSMILHLKGGSLILCIGMGTEILMFILMAFDTGSETYEREDEKRQDVHASKDEVLGNHILQGAPVTTVSIPESSSVKTETFNNLTEVVAALERNVAALNALCELQIKSFASQIEGVESVGSNLRELREMYARSAQQAARYCQETERMTQYVVQLNAVYKKMIDAMSTGFRQQPGGGNSDIYQ